ncbi:hypothetical protein EOD00_23815 [Mesorhizobium sp. M7A.T.Ca.TU.009.01.3.1]|nr:hypothetical protein EOD00_23815 [Mesorhizobium sp. M7A.T.Ca.TU.009.01.3.1]
MRPSEKAEDIFSDDIGVRWGHHEQSCVNAQHDLLGQVTADSRELLGVIKLKSGMLDDTRKIKITVLGHKFVAPFVEGHLILAV